MTAEEATAIISGAQVVVTNRDPDRFVEAVNRALLSLYDELKRANHKPLTKADQIRAMSDMELAKFLCKIIPSEGCERTCPASDTCSHGDNGMEKWLRLPAEED